MVQINFALKEVNCKIVYYGPGLSGKTTNLQMVHEKMPVEHKGRLTSIATEGERTLFFDFLPLDLGSVAGMRTKFQLYTVPGQVYYNATRKLVLKGVDGVVFVADSQPQMMAENLQSWQNLQDNLAEHGLTLDDVPVVFQYNKRDVPEAVPVQLMNDRLNAIGAPWYEAVASAGKGVLPVLRGIAGLVLDRLNGAAGRGAAVAASGAAKAGVGGTSASHAGTGAATRIAGGVATAREPSLPRGEGRTSPSPLPPQEGLATGGGHALDGRPTRTPPPPWKRERDRQRPEERPVPDARSDGGAAGFGGQRSPTSGSAETVTNGRATTPSSELARAQRGVAVRLEEGMGSGTSPRARQRRSRAYIAVAASVLVAASAAAAAFFLLFRR